ncbi:unannotated protein [freshwater metagenome]|uniref:Unannotated protein n=1 Tax=freshwater metagenome TaxID=449393 RepID=A0A6J7MPP1_9ZZZZ
MRTGTAPPIAPRVAGGKSGTISLHASITARSSGGAVFNIGSAATGSGSTFTSRTGSLTGSDAGVSRRNAPIVGRDWRGERAASASAASGATGSLATRLGIMSGSAAGAEARAPAARSKRSTRSNKVCSGGPASRRTRRTSATSRTNRGSAASKPRISVTASPSVSIIRTSVVLPSERAKSRKRSWSSSGAETTTRSPAALSMKMSRAQRKRSSATRRGS